MYAFSNAYIIFVRKNFAYSRKNFCVQSYVRKPFCQARTGRGIHGLPKVSCGPAMPDPYTPCGRATPQTALRPFGGWPARRAGGLRPSSSCLDTPSRTGPCKIRSFEGHFHSPVMQQAPYTPCGQATPQTAAVGEFHGGRGTITVIHGP